MGDWDDDNFTVPDLLKKLPVVVPTSWEDEEDEALVEPEVKSSKLTPVQIESNKKKLIEEELAFQTKLKLSVLANETPEERKAREKRQVEEADNELTGELFDTGGSKSPTKTKEGTSDVSTIKGIGSTVLKTKQDHVNFGSTISKKLSDSSAFNIAAFYKSLSKVLESPSMTSEVIEEIFSEISKIKEAKFKLEKPG